MEKILKMNKILISKDEEIVQNRMELEKQDTKIHKFQQQIKESQQQINNNNKKKRV